MLMNHQHEIIAKLKQHGYIQNTFTGRRCVDKLIIYVVDSTTRAFQKISDDAKKELFIFITVICKFNPPKKHSSCYIEQSKQKKIYYINRFIPLRVLSNSFHCVHIYCKLSKNYL